MNNRSRNRTTRLLLAICVAIAGATPTFAQDNVTIQSGSSVEIDRHNDCRVIRNSGNSPINVPLRHAGEWSQGTGSFLNNIGDMDRVGVQDCVRSVLRGIILVAFSDMGGPPGQIVPYWRSEVVNTTGASLPLIFFSNRDNLCARVDGANPFSSIPWPFGYQPATTIPHATAEATMRARMNEFVPPTSGYCVYTTFRTVMGRYGQISDVDQLTAYIYAN
tara:strand:+ start:203 stop:859 length:657 start_codon:yes stop_codon:yes gene_type:complete